MKTVCAFFLGFFVLISFSFPTLSQVEISESDLIEYRSEIRKYLTALKPQLMEKNPPLGIIIRDFPFEWDNFQKEILDLSEVHLKEMLDNAVITESTKEDWNWVHVIMDTPKLGGEIARIGIRLQFKYFPYYLSQASDDASQELLYAMIDVLRGYQSGTWGNKTSCFDWISGGVLVPPFGSEGKVFPQTMVAINKIFESGSEAEIRNYYPFLKDEENSEIFYKMLQLLTTKFGSDGAFNLYLLFNVKELIKEEDRLLVCEVNQFFFKSLSSRWLPRKRNKFYRDFLIWSHSLDEKVTALIETRKQILANQ